MKPRFSAPLITEKVLYCEKSKILWLIPRKKTKFFWVVRQEFSLLGEDGKVIGKPVPVGFKTDFSSVPWVFRLFVPKDDVDSQAAVWHDRGYHCNKPKSVVPEHEKWRNESGTLMTKNQIDSGFLIGMKICNQDPVKAFTKWRAVVRFGVFGWNKKDKELEPTHESES